ARRVVMNHLAQREYESAEYALDHVEVLSGGDRGVLAWVEVERELLGHRREEQRLLFGKLTRQFIEAQRARLERLDAFLDSPDPDVRAFAMLTESEILLVLGDRK